MHPLRRDLGGICGGKEGDEMNDRQNEIAEMCTVLYRAWGMHPDLSLGEFLHEFIFPKIQITMGEHSFELRAPKACTDREFIDGLWKAMR